MSLRVAVRGEAKGQESRSRRETESEQGASRAGQTRSQVI